MKKSKIKVGLIGEDPNDTDAIRNLLSQKFKESLNYKTLSKNFTGGHLKSEKAFRFFRNSCKNNECDVFIFMIDADGTESNESKIKETQDWHRRMIEGLKVKNLLLVHVYELEALVFADLETFNREYGTEIKLTKKKVSEIENPKEKLIRQTRPEKPYQVSHCPDLFSKMNIETVIQNCPYFKKFTEDFEKMIAA